MRKLAGIALATVAALIIWVALVAAGTREGWWRALPAPRGDIAAFIDAARARFAAESKGNIALALLVNGRVAGSLYISHGRPVDSGSLFQVASMSKWITAVGVMRLVEQKRIDLDAPISRYLKRWKLPSGKFDNDGVTVRRVLAHVAGLTDGLGYQGFAPGQKPQSLSESLNQAADAQPGADGIVRAGIEPGTTWRYSGGGYAMLQMMIEDVTGKPFNNYIRETVLEPLGMTRSTFVSPDPAHLAEVYDADGHKTFYRKFTALAAASLYTSIDDVTRFLEAQLPGRKSVLKPQSLSLMRQPMAHIYGIPVWGLGEILYAPNGKGGFVVGHDGTNAPGINTTARIDPETGDGIIVLSSGNPTLATEIGGDWIFWQTGVIDLLTIYHEIGRTLSILAIGAGLILLAAIVVFLARAPVGIGFLSPSRLPANIQPGTLKRPP
jgi:CubicO group peptidase (beta-lactamase class C family)